MTGRDLIKIIQENDLEELEIDADLCNGVLEFEYKVEEVEPSDDNFYSDKYYTNKCVDLYDGTVSERSW